MMVFVSSEHPFTVEREIPWARLARQPIVALTRESNIRLLTEFGFESAGIPLRPHLEVHQIHTALSLVESRAGVAVLPTYAFAALRGWQIAVRTLSDPTITRNVSLITARDRASSPATINVRGMLRQVLRSMVPDTNQRFPGRQGPDRDGAMPSMPMQSGDVKSRVKPACMAGAALTERNSFKADPSACPAKPSDCHFSKK